MHSQTRRHGWPGRSRGGPWLWNRPDPSTAGLCIVCLARQTSAWVRFRKPHQSPESFPIPAAGGGASLVKVTLWDAEGNRSLPLLQYQHPVSSNWMDATVVQLDGQPYSLMASVEAMPTGTIHQLVWNAAADLGSGFSGVVLLRAAAVDITLVGDWSPAAPYHVVTSADSDGERAPGRLELRHGFERPLDGGGRRRQRRSCQRAVKNQPVMGT